MSDMSPTEKPPDADGTSRPFRRIAPLTWIFYSISVGIIAGIFCSAFFLSLEYARHLAFTHCAGIPLPPPAGEELFGPDARNKPNHYLFFLLPIIGGLVSGLLVYKCAPEAEGHGTDALIDAFHNKKGVIRSRTSFVKAAASILTLATGGSAGREGPIAQIGGGLGSWLARVLNLSVRERRILLLAGTAGGLGAIFRSPLGGAITAIEVLYREDFESDALVPSIISSVSGYTVFSTVFGHQSIFRVPRYTWNDPKELLLYALLALICVPFGILFIKTFYTVRDRFFSPLSVPRVLKPMLGGIGVACIGLFLPEVYGTGWGHIQRAVLGELSIGLMFFIALGKIFATSFTIGSGGSGGVFGPSLFIGAMLGGAFGGLCHQYLPHIVTQPGTFVLVGMCAFFSGVAHAPIGALLMICEMSGSYGLIAPLMLVSVITMMFTRRWSIYAKQVKDKFESPAHVGDLTINVLEHMKVKDVLVLGEEIPVVQSSMSFPELRGLLGKTSSDYFAVYEGQRLCGILSLKAIRPILFEDSADAILVVQDVAMPLVTVTPETSLYEALIAFLRSGYERIPVTSEDDSNRILGFLRQEDVMMAYRTAIVKKDAEGAELVPRGKLQYRRSSHHDLRALDHVHLQAGFTIARVRTPASLVGRSLREANLRAAHRLTVVAVRHKGKGDEQLPDPEEPLGRDDILVVVGSPLDISRFRHDEI